MEFTVSTVFARCPQCGLVHIAIAPAVAVFGLLSKPTRHQRWYAHCNACHAPTNMFELVDEPASVPKNGWPACVLMEVLENKLVPRDS